MRKTFIVVTALCSLSLQAQVRLTEKNIEAVLKHMTLEEKAHAAVTRQSAVEGMVLLKNENHTLPFRNDIKHIGLYGVTSYDFIAGGTGSGDVNKAYTIDLVTELTGAGYQVDSVISHVYAKYKEFQTVNMQASASKAWFGSIGQVALPEMQVNRQMIENQAQHHDIGVITLGRISGENMDREVEGDFNLTEVELELLKNVTEVYHQLGKKVETL